MPAAPSTSPERRSARARPRRDSTSDGCAARAVRNGSIASAGRPVDRRSAPRPFRAGVQEGSARSASRYSRSASFERALLPEGRREARADRRAIGSLGGRPHERIEGGVDVARLEEDGPVFREDGDVLRERLRRDGEDLAGRLQVALGPGLAAEGRQAVGVLRVHFDGPLQEAERLVELLRAEGEVGEGEEGPLVPLVQAERLPPHRVGERLLAAREVRVAEEPVALARGRLDLDDAVRRGLGGRRVAAVERLAAEREEVGRRGARARQARRDGSGGRKGSDRHRFAEGAPAREGRLVGPAGLFVGLGEERPGVAVELVLRVVPEVVDDLGEPSVLELLLAGPLQLRQVGKRRRNRLRHLGLHVVPEIPELGRVELLDDLERRVVGESRVQGLPGRLRVPAVQRGVGRLHPEPSPAAGVGRGRGRLLELHGGLAELPGPRGGARVSLERLGGRLRLQRGAEEEREGDEEEADAAHPGILR